MTMRTDRLTTLDLFSGCGGLSLGLRKAGFAVAVAVEIDKAAAETYERNIPGAIVLQKDIREVEPEDLKSLIGESRVSLIAGCAPCQGFCSLTSKYLREDPRNELLRDMARLIGELQPDAVMMENVPGLATRGQHVLEQFTEELKRNGYTVESRIVQMADYGVPQYRRRLVILAGKGFSIPFPSPVHARSPAGGPNLLPWVTLRSAIWKMPPPIRLSDAQRRGGPQKLNWHVVRDLQPQTKARLRAAIPGKTWLEVDELLRPKCHRGDYRGFTNVYGRMVWDQVSVTITGGCTTPCKGRFGHPDRRRSTISVREAALIQTFPMGYQFATDHMDSACGMIANAVPPLFAELVGRQIRDALEKHYGTLAG